MFLLLLSLSLLFLNYHSFIIIIMIIIVIVIIIIVFIISGTWAVEMKSSAEERKWLTVSSTNLARTYKFPPETDKIFLLEQRQSDR